MNGYYDSDEEDNNPFSGTNHLYASGIAAVPEGQDDFVPPTILANIQEKEETRDELMHQLFGSDMAPHKELKVDETETVAQEWEAESAEVEPSAPPLLRKSRSTEEDRVPSFCMPVDNQEIKIVDAGHFRDANGKYAIGYTIEFEGKQVVRRYSDFDTLRHALYRLLPTIIVPPIPSKHPLIRYFLNPLSAEKDIRIIDRRKRLLSLFLNNCYGVVEIRQHIVFRKFLDSEQVWRHVLNSPPISIIPANSLLAPPLQQTKPSPLHLLLPSTAGNHTVLEPINKDDAIWGQEDAFKQYELVFKKFEKVLSPLEKQSKQSRLHFQALASSLAELGAYYNAFSLEGNILTLQDNMRQIDELSKGIEKVGQAIDVNYVNSEIVSEQITILIEEPMAEMVQTIVEARHVLHFREQKMGQYRIVESTIKRREKRIKSLEDAQEQMLRLEEALRKNAEQSPTVAQAIKNMDGWNKGSNEMASNKSHPKLLEVSNKHAHAGNAGWTDLFKSRRSRTSGSRRHGSSSDARELEPHLLTDEERKEEAAKVTQELQKLNECFKLITKDVKQVNSSADESLQHMLRYLKERCSVILKAFAHVLLVWLRESLVAWQNTKPVIENINVRP
ncbi:LAME_0G13938g1_1 [Lachancea meyersii CBS 8951]|uniref:LAME_0G13938g1_1 n=1 Tax=Lachancea meyersii CBS 8951 TaxID=1266667 RepID=A0A1G4KAE1_9SACH|nr:LAME_0G13938g1_1 [Lachancea meyersii CBS 8951]